MNASELLKKRRNLVRRRQNRGLLVIPGKVQGLPVYCLHGVRRIDSMNCIWGNLRKRGNFVLPNLQLTTCLSYMKKMLYICADYYT